MNRCIRMSLLLVASTLVATHTPVNAVLVMIVALSFEVFSPGDFFVLLIAALFMDHAGYLPLAVSLAPLAATYGVLHLLKSQIYVHSFPSRLIWSVSAVIFYNVLWAVVLMLRGVDPFFAWVGIFRMIPVHAAEGALAALLSPALHYLLTITWAELRRPRRIVVP